MSACIDPVEMIFFVSFAIFFFNLFKTRRKLREKNYLIRLKIVLRFWCKKTKNIKKKEERTFNEMSKIILNNLIQKDDCTLVQN